MKNLIDKFFNLTRTAVLGLALGFLVLGPNVAAMTSPPHEYVPGSSYVPSYEKVNVDGNSCDVYTMGLGGYFQCVLDNSANCPLWKGAICTAASAIIVTALYALPAWAAVKSLASAAQSGVKRALTKLINIVKKWPTTSITIGTVTYNIPWSSLATLLEGTNWGKAISFLLLNDYAKAKRLCKCLIC